jgi:penicillin-binding protein 1A
MAKSKSRQPAKREPVLFSADRAAQGRGKPPSRARGSVLGFLFRWTFKLGFLAAIAVTCVIGYAWFSLNERGLFKIPEREPGIMMLASDGSVLAELGSFYGDEALLEELPDYVPHAVIAAEDRRFRQHYGVDPVGILRALIRSAQAGRMVQGGSTITQQLAKNLFLTPERTAWRKIQEAVLAVWLERKFSKDEILQLYLNRVYFGGGKDNGIEAAAKLFYNTTSAELSLGEAAALAGLLPKPNAYNPLRDTDVSQERMKLVLSLMVEQGYVSQEEAKLAVSAPAQVKAADYVPTKQYVIDWVKDQIPQLASKYDQSIVVETTLDPVIQSSAEQSLRKRLADNGKKLRVSQGALVILDASGAVKAMVGGRSYKRSQFNRATSAKRQPGSAFKPFVYLAAIEQGYRPESVEVDEPVRIGDWQPENYRQKYLGRVTLETAFAQSLNTIAAKLAYDVGPKRVAETAERLGISSKLGNDVSLALGTSEVSLMELTTAFAPFANGGELVSPHVVTRIATRDGDVLYERVGSGLGKVVTDYDLGAMNSLFRAVVRQGTAKNARFGDFDIGGKTGTSQNYRDAWFVGFTPYLIGGVWLGNDDNSPTKNVTGGSLPALIWRDVMMEAHQGLSPAILPGESLPAGDLVADSGDFGPEVMAQEDIQVAEERSPRRKRYLLDYLFGDDEPPRETRRYRRDDGQDQADGGLY